MQQVLDRALGFCLDLTQSAFGFIGLLTLGICSLHFTAMGAALIVPDPTIVVDGFSADASTLALAIAGLTVLVMVAGLAAAVIDRQTSQSSVERTAARLPYVAGF